MTFQRKLIMGVVLMLALALGTIFLLSEGGEEEIRSILDKGLNAVKSGEENTLVDMLSLNYQSGNETYETMSDRIRSMFSEPSSQTYRFIGEPSIDIHENQADVGITVRVSIGPKPIQQGEFHVVLQKEEAGWRITSVSRLR